MSVKVFTLKNGRDVIATITSETEECYVVDNALVAIMKQSGQDRLEIQLVPVSPLVDQSEKGTTIEINKDALCFAPNEPNTEVSKVYAQIKSPLDLNMNMSGFVRN